MELEHALVLTRSSGAAISLAAVVIGLVLIVSVVRTPWFVGHLGELRVRFALRRDLDRSVYHAIHDVTLPTAGGTTQIDHIVVSRYGVFVIETKTMKGRIYGRASDRLWTQSFPSRSFTFLNPLRQNFGHLKAVQAILGIENWRIHSFVVFAGDATFATPMPENVCGIAGLVSALRARTRAVLSEAEVRSAVERLEASRIPTLVAGWLHRRSLRQRRERALAGRPSRGPSDPRSYPGGAIR